MSENPNPLSESSITEKVNRGEEMTPAESEFMAGVPNMDQGEGNPPADKPKEDSPAEEPGDKGEENPEDPPTEDPPSEDPPAEDPPAEDPPAEGDKTKDKPKQTKDEVKERRALIEAELEKPESSMDLSKFSETEIGLFFDLKRERAKRQTLEGENRIHRFNSLKEKLNPPAKPAQEEAPPIDEIFKDREDDDLPTVGELRKLFGKKKPAENNDAPVEEGNRPLRTPEEIGLERREAALSLRDRGILDFNDVMEYTKFALEEDPHASQELQDAARQGFNVPERTYWLIKGSKRWPEVKAAIQARKGRASAPSPENLRTAERIKANGNKTRTSGPGGGRGATGPGEFSAQQVKEMSINDFKNLPQATQDKLLRQFGSEPNY